MKEVDPEWRLFDLFSESVNQFMMMKMKSGCWFWFQTSWITPTRWSIKWRRCRNRKKQTRTCELNSVLFTLWVMSLVWLTFWLAALCRYRVKDKSDRATVEQVSTKTLLFRKGQTGSSQKIHLLFIIEGKWLHGWKNQNITVKKEVMRCLWIEKLSDKLSINLINLIDILFESLPVCHSSITTTSWDYHSQQVVFVTPAGLNSYWSSLLQTERSITSKSETFVVEISRLFFFCRF